MFDVLLVKITILVIYSHGQSKLSKKERSIMDTVEMYTYVQYITRNLKNTLNIAIFSQEV